MAEQQQQDAEASGGEGGGIERWDLTHVVSPYLDRHMIFPLLEYLDTLIVEKKVSYDTKDVAAARLALLRPTHMVDYACDVLKSVHGDDADIPQEMLDQKQKVFADLEKLGTACEPFQKLCENKEERVRPPLCWLDLPCLGIGD